MVHLSEVLSLPVLDSEGSRLGRLEDLWIDPVTGQVKSVCLARDGESVGISWKSVTTFSPETRKVVICKAAPLQSTPECEGDVICLKRNLLDRQIIDTNGRKVVRVNDLALELVNGDLYLRRVEVGLAGAVRRLVAGILSPRLVRRLADGLPERDIPWDYVGLVEPEMAQIRLKVHQQLARMHPADIADIIEDLGRVERGELVSILDTETAAQALSEVEPPVQATVVEDMLVERAADLLEEMQPDEAADILGDLPAERSKALLEAMEVEEAEEVRELLSFDEDTAGGLMTTEFFKADPGWTVAQTLAALREADPDLLGEMDEIPLADSRNRLVGMVPLVRLVRRLPDEPVTSAMRRDARAVLPTAPLSDIVERFEKYHLRGLAVVDEFGLLEGLITIEDLLSRLAPRG
jgi:sporulation protein YlmC with PRC-barrel domain/CBS domain-containing protein